MFAARRSPRTSQRVPFPVRRRCEPKSLALLVDVVLARYGILPLAAQVHAEPLRKPAVSEAKQALLFPVT